ncbi:MAG TPA: SDR family oxidoreductase [Vicinamibacterales bacterium]|nr:SDR family oxidoreductase [Vicinamibacterales bacterium]
MILVVGATGRLGGEITQRLLARGDRVRVLVRKDSPAEQLAQQGLATSPERLIAAGADPVYGDMKDKPSLDEACRNVDVVITTANSAMRGGPDNAQSVDLDGNHDLIDAARRAGVRQFIFVSATLADPTSPIPFLQAKGKTEQTLQSSGLAYTIIAPDAFMDVWVAMVVGMPALSSQPVVVVGSGNRKQSFIAAQDVAQFVAAAVDNAAALNKRLVLGGPQAVSFRDAAGVFSRVLGREVAVRSVDPGTPIPHLPDMMVAMLAGFDMRDSIVETAPLAEAFGVPLTSVETFARQMVQAQA